MSIIVVGAGVGGLATVIGLQALGHHVTLLEQARQAESSGASLGVQSNAALALRALGVAEPVLAAGVEVREYVLRSWRGRDMARWSLADVARTLGTPSVTVPRAVLLAALRSAVPAADVMTGSRVESVVEDRNGVTVRVDGGSAVSAELVVGADGLNSTVRAHVTGEVKPPLYAGYDSWRGTAETTDGTVEGGTAVHVLGSGRSFGAWPLPHGRTYWVATLANPAPDTDMRGAFADAPWLVRDLLAATDPGRVLRTPIYDRDLAPVWHTARSVLVGDAIHPMQPTTGQGASQALLDAIALTKALRGVDLADRTTLARALATYRSWRAPAVAGMVQEAREIGRMHHLDSAIATRVRDLVLRATPRRVWQRRAQARLDELQLLSDWDLVAGEQGEPSWKDTQ
jgi:2-polyprenyl-6-methoxyphenol hydroxylase-like FAD-dependent oxidoreductase